MKIAPIGIDPPVLSEVYIIKLHKCAGASLKSFGTQKSICLKHIEGSSLSVMAMIPDMGAVVGDKIAFSLVRPGGSARMPVVPLFGSDDSLSGQWSSPLARMIRVSGSSIRFYFRN
jgi:hypothetical protein